MTNQNIDDFVGMSVVLTGFAEKVLKSATDPYDQAGQYLDFLESDQSGVGEDLPGLLALYAEHASEPPSAIGKTIMSSEYADLARRIIKLWYSGMWYGQNGFPFQVVSAQAYTLGLVWRAAQAHPMGYSPYRFGYWEADPPPLSAFTGEPQRGGGAQS